MVSALVTSPWLQERIFSGDAIEILIALKSLIGLRLVRTVEVVASGVSFLSCTRSRVEPAQTFSSSTSRQRLWSSRTSTLNDSGRPGSSGTSPLTIAS